MEFIKAKSINEAVMFLKKGYIPAAGCTNLYVYIKKGLAFEKAVDITELTELKSIFIDDAGLHIGALSTFSDLERFLADKPEYKALYSASYSMGGPQIRNRATIAGNICDASPACDSGTPLLVLNAEIKALSDNGIRNIPVNDFFIGRRKTALENGELVTEIFLPHPQNNRISFFKKIGLRNAMAISVLNAAGCFENGAIKLAMGSVAEKPVRLYNCEKTINCGILDSSSLKNALSLDISPITDLRASAEYRFAAAYNVLLSSLKEVFGYDII